MTDQATKTPAEIAARLTPSLRAALATCSGHGRTMEALRRRGLVTVDRWKEQGDLGGFVRWESWSRTDLGRAVEALLDGEGR